MGERMVEDLISRQAAIEALGEEPEVWEDPWTTDSDYSKGQRSQWKSDKLAIQAVPSAQKKGKCLQNKARYFFCSECHYGVADVFEGNYKNEEQPYVFDNGKEWNFCPNCGAKMVSDDEA